jgi:hypothetical protein
MSGSKWETTTRNATALSLDSKNPRLAQITQQSTERELLEELVAKEDVHSLARSIAESGYFPNEVLVANRDGHKTVVVEGNRRLAACKLLISPDAAPTIHQARFRGLSAKANLAQLKAIPICIAPSREATHAIVLKRHTKLPISKWEPPMQAKFYRQLLDSGLSIEEIVKSSGQSEAEVRENLRNHHLYEMACRLDLPADIVGKVHDPHLFPLSTLGRVFDVPTARKFFGVEVDQNGEIHGKIPEDEFTKGFGKLVADLVRGDTTSRSLNKASDITNYLSKFPAANRPSVKKKGSFTSSSFRLTAVVPSSAAPSKPKAKLPSKPQVGLIPNTIGCNISNQRVKNLFEELRRLSPEKFPNACAFLFRCFLEMAVFYYLDSKGEIKAMLTEFQTEVAAQNAKSPPDKQRQVPPHWTPDLNGMMKRMRDPKRGLIPSGHISKALGKTLDDEQELFALNLYIHNPTYHPDGAKLRTTWVRFEELMKVMLA